MFFFQELPDRSPACYNQNINQNLLPLRGALDRSGELNIYKIKTDPSVGF